MNEQREKSILDNITFLEELLDKPWYSAETKFTLKRLFELMNNDLAKNKKGEPEVTDCEEEEEEEYIPRNPAISRWRNACYKEYVRNSARLYSGELDYYEYLREKEDYYNDNDYDGIHKNNYDDSKLPETLDAAIAAGLDPTQALNDYLYTILGDAARYSGITETIQTMVQRCLDHGAKFPYNRLFGRYEAHEGWEHESSEYPIRACIIDYLKPECAKEYADWKTIPARDWEDMTDDENDDDEDDDYDEFEDTYDDSITDTMRYQTLKYHSDYLQSL